MDMQKRQQLATKIDRMIEENILLAVPMDDFFDGNTDDRSMGRGMQTSREIPIGEYREVFRSIRGRDDVQEIFILINESPDDHREWWQAHIVYVITSAPVAEVEEWFEPLEPRGAGEGWFLHPGTAAPLGDSEIAPGMRPVGVELL